MNIFNDIIYSSNRRFNTTNHSNNNNFFFNIQTNINNSTSTPTSTPTTTPREPILSIPLETIEYNNINEEIENAHNELNSLYYENRYINNDSYLNNIYVDYITSIQENIISRNNYFYDIEDELINNEIDLLISEMNTEIDKKLIKKKITDNTLFTNYHNSNVKNDTCPILYSLFEKDDKICIFKNCKHCIDESMFNKYIETFENCPLCKCKLY